MIKLNLIGGGFQHHIQCSSALNKNKVVEWVLDNSSSQSVYVDRAILNENVNSNKKNYGWFAESSAIIPDLIQTVLNNLDYYFDKFTYIFTHDVRLLPYHPNFLFTPPNALSWIQQKNIYPKSKRISMIASNKTMCAGHLYRQNIIQKYKNEVDHFGRGFENQIPWTYIDNGIEESGKLIGLKDYMFSIAMENDNYDVIFCEKLTDCFATGTIPIYWGSKKVAKVCGFDENGIIWLDDIESLELINTDMYMSKLESIKNNFDRIFDLPSAEDYFYINYL